MTRTFSYSIDKIFAEIERFNRLQTEYKAQTLAEMITKYDFIVGSIECKHRLMEVFPKGANIICSPYIESPTTIYAIKKFDTMDLIMGTQTESKDCQDCKEFEDCPCGKDGHESGTSQGYSIGECKDFVPQERSE